MSVLVEAFGHVDVTPRAAEEAQAVRRQLLRLAKYEDDLAVDELAQVPYWEPAPFTAVAHREAARLLRQHADVLLASIRAVVRMVDEG